MSDANPVEKEDHKPAPIQGPRHELRAIPAILSLRGMKLTGAQHTLLVHMSLYANRAGKCWASVATLSWATDQDPRTVQRTLGQLVKLGVLVRTDRGSHESAVYHLRLHRLERSSRPLPRRHAIPRRDATPPSEITPGVTPPPLRRDATPPLAGCHPPPGVTPPDPSNDPSLDPNKDPGESVSAVADTDSDAAAPEEGVEVTVTEHGGLKVYTTDPGRRQRKPEEPPAKRTVRPTAPDDAAPRGIASQVQAELPHIGDDYADDKVQADPVPKWARTRDFRREDGTPAERMALVHRAVQTIRGKPVDPTRMATNAKCVIALWKALERPPLAEFVDELVLVAEAAHDCPDKLFARDIRGEGWAEGRDRSRDVSTICVQARWTARLDAAQAWDAAGRGRGSKRADGFDPEDPQAIFRRDRERKLAEQARKYGGRAP